MSTLKIAIQKSGRLNEDSIQILKDCGISINNGNDQLKATASNFPLEVLYLRNSDIPQYLIQRTLGIALPNFKKDMLLPKALCHSKFHLIHSLMRKSRCIVTRESGND